MKKILAAMFLFTITVFGNAVVIAHRGYSGKYPENTFEAFDNAKYYADYLEQDLQMTKDNRLVVFHDTVLNNVTDVEKVFTKERARKDGKYYVIDFTLDELKKLKVTNRYFILWKFKFKQFKNREYASDNAAQICSFEEVLDLVRDYNAENNGKLGIYPELKDVWFYKSEGKDTTLALFDILGKYDYSSKQDEIFIQSYDSTELQRVKNEINPEYGVNYKLVQLIPKRRSGDIKVFQNGKKEKYNYKYFYTKDGLDSIRKYADAIGPDKSLIYGNSKKDEYYRYAKEAGFLVHVYTFNIERVGKGFKSYEDEVRYYRDELKIDGYFTDYSGIEVE
jgi:glycerophosphoryl diester phosphodiesterase